MLTCCIIDDEPHAISVLIDFISVTDGLELIFSDSDPFSALRILAGLKKLPDIVFCDIDMPDFTGLELANLVNRNCQLVYTTAHSQYAIQAFEKKQWTIY